MARGRTISIGGKGSMGPRTVKLRTTVGRALPATNGGSGKTSIPLAPWKGAGRTKTGI